MQTNIPEIGIKYKRSQVNYDSIHSQDDVYKTMLKMYDDDSIDYLESFIVMFLDSANVPIAFFKASQGGLTGCLVDVRSVLTMALKCGAVQIILSHNHPSGRLKPSQADKNLTKKINNACDILDISLLDHLIISREDYFSFKTEGII